MSEKYFTLAEAEALLPMVKEELDHLQQLQNEFQEKYVELRTMYDREGAFELESQMEFLEIQANMHVNNLYAHGVQLKDIDQGLVDFPALINGEEVLLCWKQGEDQIEYYHGVHEGFRGRKKLE
ncbi:DUF2203 domain-containing protein [Ammoniphilus resinae]|uniref:Cell division protein DivIVA n=1 Tax=Ammoniphilus resinae TaxID=861532 RepID=A0ABS4GKQ9_9BACL|nr:DUF2203 domain-containing protein [Ammoniphilus resinae]MBP1930814.1 hypothetical protein [Ammoniphilus resinae]